MARLKIQTITAFLIFSLTQGVLGQKKSIPAKIGQDVGSVVHGTGHVLTSPFRWDKKQWVTFGGVMAGTAALSLFDEEIHDYVQRHRSKTFKEIAEIGNDYGEPMTVTVLTGGLYGISLITGSEWLRESCVILTASLLPAGGYQTVTSISVGRGRPIADRGPHAFEPFQNERPYVSFFSGHTIVSFATSHVFARQTENIFLKTILYAGATSTAFARMYDNAHWLTDVSLGALVAILSVDSASKLIAKRNGNAGERPSRFGWSVRPWSRGGQVQLRW